jgi:hypothetical protein
VGATALRRIAVLGVLLVASFVAPASALAQSGSGSSALNSLPGSTSPFSPGLPESTPSETTSTTTPTVSSTSSSTNSGLSGSGIAAIAVGALVVLGGISFFIWYDARRKAPVRRAAAALAGGDGRRAGSKAKPKTRKLSPAERKRRKRGRAR